MLWPFLRFVRKITASDIVLIMLNNFFFFTWEHTVSAKVNSFLFTYFYARAMVTTVRLRQWIIGEHLLLGMWAGSQPERFIQSVSTRRWFSNTNLELVAGCDDKITEWPSEAEQNPRYVTFQRLNINKNKNNYKTIKNDYEDYEEGWKWRPRGQRRGSGTLCLLGLQVRNPPPPLPSRGHECLCLVSVVCCQVKVCTWGWSLVQRRPTDCGVSQCDREVSIMRRPWHHRGCRAIKTK